MTVNVSDAGVIRLEGVCPIEDAEALLRRLTDDREASVDWSACERAHTAVAQVLLAVRPTMLGTPRDPFLRVHIAGLFGPRSSGG